MTKRLTTNLKQVLATLLTIAALMAGQNAWAQTQSFPTSSGGLGYSSNPYLIKTTADLNALASDVNSGTNYSNTYFKLDNDIDFQPTTAWNDTTSTEDNFSAIGNSSNFFSGHFDGDGHSISGIRIYKDGTDASADYQGLFGEISSRGTIQKVTLTDARITGYYNVGGIVGNVNHSNNSVSDCHVTSTVAIHAVTNDALYHGGIAGLNWGTVSGCTSAATVSIAYGITNCVNYGGIVGRNANGTVSNCLAEGATVDGSNYTGAIVGYYFSNSTLTTNYYRNCTVNGNTTNVGVGKNNSSQDVEGARGIGILTTTTGVTATGEMNGTVVINNTTYHYGGQTISLTYSGEIPTGYVFNGFTVTTANGSTVEVTESEGTYTFTMPAENVTVSASINLTWNGLQTLLDAASTDEESPTLITLSNDVVAASTDSRLLVTYNKHVIIDLNGYAIDRHLSEPKSNGEVIFVRGSGNSSTNGPGHLTIRDSSNLNTGRITGGYAQYNCGGVNVVGFFTLESGSICGNKAPQMAAGVYVNSGGTFTMTGGSITNNTIDSDDNLASAIYMYPTGTTFNMSGGTISGNHGGQWAIEIKGNFNLSGTYDISGNTKSDNTAACDIYCLSNSHITITDPISPVHPSTVGTSQTVLTNGWSTYMGSTDPATCFTPFESNKVLVVADGEVEVIIGTRVESITVTPAEIYPTVGATYSIVFSVLPADATNPAVTFSSSDEDVATVDENGTVTAVAAGTATITIAATDGSGVTSTLTVNVMNIDVEEIRAQDITMITSGTATINYQVIPEQATDKSVTFTSANTAIATVNENGVVTGVGMGVTTITIASVQNPDVTTPVEVTVNLNPTGTQFTKGITGYGNNENPGGWYLIASPLADIVAPTAVTNMTNETFDLYYFDQTGGSNGKEWKNWKNEGGEGYLFNLEAGQGYLYANSGNVSITFEGTPYTGDGIFELKYSQNNPDENMRGWNLVGNPFTVNAYIDRPFYIMNDQGSEIIAAVDAERNYIKPMEGIFVKAGQDGETMTFTAEPVNSPNPELVINVNQTVTNRGNATATVIDRAIVRFDEGRQLPKLQIFENSSKLYIPKDGKDYAIVSVGSDAPWHVSTMDVNFKANEDGEYTITVSPENVEMAYLHLIDNMTGADVDLLPLCKGGRGDSNQPAYTFTARTTDYASRFKLVFVSSICEDNNDDNAPFAFFSNGNIIITADADNATLQVIDVMGRVVTSVGGHTRCVPMAGMTAGVYVLRLVNGNDVKTQKIVIR